MILIFIQSSGRQGFMSRSGTLHFTFGKLLVFCSKVGDIAAIQYTILQPQPLVSRLISRIVGFDKIDTSVSSRIAISSFE